MKIPKSLAVGLLSLAAALANMAPAAASNGWTEFVYNPSGQALMPVQPPEVLQDSVRIDFAPGQFVALLTTSESSVTGDLSTKTLNDNILIEGVTGSFVDQNSGGCSPDNKYVRFYFTSPAGSGPSFPAPGQILYHGAGGVPAGFYTQSWWSNPIHMDLTGNGSDTITVQVGDASQWSDWNGQVANSSPAVEAQFNKAIQRVQSVGLSFGGGCFFENGVSVDTDGGSFESQFSVI